MPNPSLTHEEIRAHAHPILATAEEFRVVRYEANLAYDTGIVTDLVLVVRSRSGESRRLRFQNPRMEDQGPLQFPDTLLNSSVYVVDTTFRGWESSRRIEVGSKAKDKPAFFWAESVELIP